MITIFKIFESKQVGILYHWTDTLSKLRKILEQDRMISNEGYISFSRNKSLNFYGHAIKIIFDGDKMSTKFKFEPHMYASNIHYKKEAEERIKCKYKTRDDWFKNDYINDIKRFIIGIEISFRKDADDFNYTEHEKLNKEIENINKLIPNIKIRIKEMETDNKLKSDNISNYVVNPTISQILALV